MGKYPKLIIFAFFLSGLAALVYEVTWVKKLGLIFGTTTYAVSTVLAVFFTGLALGSFVFGRLVDKYQRPLLTYALLELGIGIYALFTPQIFELIKSLQISFWQRFEPASSGFSLFTFLLSTAGLIIPTTLMGGTLPAISKFFVTQKETLGEKISILYAVNTAGAVLGTILAGFALMILLGVNGAIWFAALINVLVGLVAFGISRIDTNLRRIDTNERISSLADIRFRFASISILVAYAASGFAALALEVLWTRVLVMILGSSTYAFSIMLVTFLFGIAVGSAVISRFIDKKENVLPYFVLSQVLIGILVILSIPLFNSLPFLFFSILRKYSQSFWGMQLAQFFLSSLVMVIPTLLMGAAFPIAVKIYKTNLIGTRVGNIYAANTIGGVFGSLASGFLLIPVFGIQKTILISALLYFLVAAMLRRSLFLYLGIGLAVLFGFVFRLDRQVLTSGVFFHGETYLKEEIPGEIIFYKEGQLGTVTVRKYPDGELILQTNGKVESSTREDLDTQLLSGHLPLLFHPKPQNALVIGLGGAFSLGAVEQHKSLKEIDAVEIEPAIVEAASLFSEFNNNALVDPRLNLIVADARNYLLASKKKYDVIASEPSNPWIAGMGNLFTKEFFELGKSRLKPGGIFASWIHLYSMSEGDLKTTLRTFQEVFPHTIVFINLSSVDLLLLGNEEELAIDYEQLGERFREESVQKSLSRVFITDPVSLFGYFLLDEEATRKFSQDAPLHTDNHPILEFSAPKSLYLNTVPTNLSVLKEFQSSPLLILKGVEEAAKGKIEGYSKFREAILNAEIYYYQGKFDDSVSSFEEALVLDPRNERLKSRLVETYNTLGKAYLNLRMTREAGEMLRKSLDINPNQPEIQRLLELLRK